MWVPESLSCHHYLDSLRPLLLLIHSQLHQHLSLPFTHHRPIKISKMSRTCPSGDLSYLFHEHALVLCESCERAPAAFLCKADSASLCAACDAHIHSANPLARRHHRVPIPPTTLPQLDRDDDEDEAASWLLLNPIKSGAEVDEYLDLDQFNEGLNYSCYGGGDSIVPIKHEKEHYPLHSFDDVGLMGYGYSSSSSSYPAAAESEVINEKQVWMEVGIVPESASMPAVQVATQLSPVEREARVMRYREKKKSRKFDKTIRYASRKAYAETRPRIKGRFAKRNSSAQPHGHVFSSQSLMSDSAYGVVPSF